jgi:hypothetical protein
MSRAAIMSDPALDLEGSVQLFARAAVVSVAGELDLATAPVLTGVLHDP